MFVVIALLTLCVSAKEIAPILGYSNTQAFEKTGELPSMTIAEYQSLLDKSINSNVDHVVLFLDYRMNTEDFKEFTRYNGYKTLRVCLFYYFILFYYLSVYSISYLIYSIIELFNISIE